MIYRDIVLIRSGGDISSGIIERLYKCGFKVVVLETGNPSSIRREVSFGEAVYRKKMTINGLTSVLADGIEEVEIDPNESNGFHWINIEDFYKQPHFKTIVPKVKKFLAENRV